MNKAFLLMCACPDHPKVIKLMLLAGDRAYWCLTKLWARVAQERPNGRLRTNDPDDVEIWAGWTGERGLFAATLLKLRLLDTENGEYIVHDWAEHNAYAARADERSARGRVGANARWSGGKKGNDSKGGMLPASDGQCLLNLNLKKDFSSEPVPGLRLGEILFELIRQRDPKAVEPNWERWRVEMERIIRRDGRTAEEIESVIRWAHADQFWSGVILSPRNLREKFTQLLCKMGGAAPVIPSGDGGCSLEEWKARKRKGQPATDTEKGKDQPP